MTRLITLLTSRNIPPDLIATLNNLFTSLLSPLNILIASLSHSISPHPSSYSIYTSTHHALTPLINHLQHLQTKKTGHYTGVKFAFWDELWDTWHAIFALSQQRRPLGAEMAWQEWTLQCAKEARDKILGLLLWGDEGDYLGVNVRVGMVAGSTSGRWR
ncbi:hypothetical protein EG328_009467 [Venturia inaequalis]|uniref:Uncharacterized protein n=1 Tax=Venturia inaequalis TaxID=5025 RepID=A0A8H3VB20_VENIN|nr:hypothetical protein EG328_009467 [Venturia inaequalis]